MKHMRLRYSSMASVPLLLLLAWTAAGCGESLPAAQPVELPFTMFGVFNPLADTQAVVVYPIETGTLEPIGPEPLDAVVRSTDLTSGEIRTWRDSIVADGNKGFSHVFWSDFQAEFGRQYRMEVVRSDGETSSTTVHVPQRISVEEADDGTSRMRLAFRGAPFRIVQLDLTYSVDFAFGPAQGCPLVLRPFHYIFSYAGAEIRHENGWDLTVDLEQYIPLIIRFMIQDAGRDEVPGGFRPGLTSLTLNATIGDEAWDVPHGFLDRRVLAHPGTLTNVEHGLGFVGGGYRIEKRLYPSAAAIEDAGFYDYLEGRPGCE